MENHPHLKRSFVLLMKTIIRIFLVCLISSVLFCIGLMIGYSVLGNGASALDVFKAETWQHILDFIQ